MAFGNRARFRHHTQRHDAPLSDAERAALRRCVACQRTTATRDGRQYAAGETTAWVCLGCKYDMSIDLAGVLAEIAMAYAAAQIDALEAAVR